MENHLERIALLKEALAPHFWGKGCYMERYDKHAITILEYPDKLEELLQKYMDMYPDKEKLHFLDSPEVRYLLIASLHDSEIVNSEYHDGTLQLQLNGSASLDWPKGMKDGMILWFDGVFEMNLSRIPKWILGYHLESEDDHMRMTIVGDGEEITFLFKEISFRNA